jgi:Permuted papain-like amidase enzyme, YaeF/YiiX, C92 family
MTNLARFSVGRILLHLLAMLGDRCVRFHVGGIMREIAPLAAAPALLARMRARLIDRLVSYLTRPIKHCTVAITPDPRSLALILDRGDVLLSEGNTRVAALVKCITRSRWSHASMYVGPLDHGSDPLCIVEADIAEGVRAIRLSELNALRVRVLRPRNLNDTERSRLADWVVSRIGSEYDLAYAWVLGRDLLRRRWRTLSQSSSRMIANNATRFICCSLLAHAFALIGYPIEPVPMGISLAATADYGSLTPGDFEHATIFDPLRGPNLFFVEEQTGPHSDRGPLGC